MVRENKGLLQFLDLQIINNYTYHDIYYPQSSFPTSNISDNPRYIYQWLEFSDVALTYAVNLVLT